MRWAGLTVLGWIYCTTNPYTYEQYYHNTPSFNANAALAFAPAYIILCKLAFDMCPDNYVRRKANNVLVD